jgi:hypothetical protein
MFVFKFACSYVADAFATTSSDSSTLSVTISVRRGWKRERNTLFVKSEPKKKKMILVLPEPKLPAFQLERFWEDVLLWLWWRFCSDINEKCSPKSGDKSCAKKS